ncbi:MAG: chemotaxis protein CheX [Myxococcota bacterium]
MSTAAANVDEPDETRLYTQLGEMLSHVCVELFDTYAVSLTPASADGSLKLDTVAVIGYSSSQVRGSIGLAMSNDTLVLCTTRAGLSAADRHDWLGELSNQLLGRLKNRLLGYDLNLHMATPMVLRGLRLEVAPQDGAEMLTSPFQTDAGPLSVWMDLIAQPNFTLVPSTNPEHTCQAEGELVFF